MNASRHHVLHALLLIGMLFLAETAARAGEATEEPTDEAVKRLPELQARLIAADLVVRARVANTLAAGEKTIVVLDVGEIFRGTTSHKTIYAEAASDEAADLDRRDALWLLKATDDTRRFILEGPESILDAKRADEIKEALDAITYAALKDLKFTASLDKNKYKLDEPIRLTWTIENPTDTPIVIAVPAVWGVGLGLSLACITEKAWVEILLEGAPYVLEREREARFTFTTLGPGHREAGGTASLLRLVHRHRPNAPSDTGVLLQPGKYALELTYDTTKLVEGSAGNVPKETVLGTLKTGRTVFEVTREKLSTLDEAKSVLAHLADVEDIQTALASDDPEVRSSAIEAIRDYSCPALLTLLETMLRSEDVEVQAATCDALMMWAQHPAIIEARPFAALLEDLDAVGNPSVIARAAADLAEAQRDATMIPRLLKLLRNEEVNRVARQSIASSIGAIAGVETNTDDLDEAIVVIEHWVEGHPELVTPSDEP